jgi:hypothetical protein
VSKAHVTSRRRGLDQGLPGPVTRDASRPPRDGVESST